MINIELTPSECKYISFLIKLHVKDMEKCIELHSKTQKNISNITLSYGKSIPAMKSLADKIWPVEIDFDDDVD